MKNVFAVVGLSLFLAVLPSACGTSSDGGSDRSPGGGGGDGGSGGGDGTYVPAPRGPTKPSVVPGAAVDCESGDQLLRGRFVAPDGETPVAGAFVYVLSGDCWAGTDKDGRFSMKGLPALETSVQVQKGVFRAEGVSTPGGGALSLQVDPAEVRLAYIAGAFDTIQFVIERLGLEAERIDADSLATADLSVYDALLLNCGLEEIPAEDDDVKEALKNYVEGGGVLYASDWAEIYVKNAFPGRVEFLGRDPRHGAESTQQATIHDEGMKRALGRSTATIQFDAPLWAVIDSAPAGTRVLISGPVAIFNEDEELPDRPYVVQFDAGEGRVTFTSFHNEAITTDDMETLLEQILFQL